MNKNDCKHTVSVVVPIYNAAEFLEECLDSLSRQSFTDFEVIIVDDGSTDNSAGICRKFTYADSRFRLIKQENAGTSATRNTGIDAASGNWIVFVDADDILLPSALEILTETASATGANLVAGKFIESSKCADDLARATKRPAKHISRHTQIFDAHTITELFLYQSLKNFSICGTLINARIFADGARFNVNTRYEDLAITPLLFERARHVALTNLKTYIYRQHQGSFIHNFTRTRFDVLDVTDNILEHIIYHSPNLIAAATDRRFSAHCNMLSLIYRHEKTLQNENFGCLPPDIVKIRKRCTDVIKANRRAELLNPHVRLKNKLGALCSYFPALFRLLSKKW